MPDKEPTDLESRRTKKEGEGMTQAERENNPGFDEGASGDEATAGAAAGDQSIEDMQNGGGDQSQLADGGAPAGGEEDDGQMFVWEQGRKVTLGTLISRGTPIEHAFVFGGKRVRGSGGLMGFDEDVLIVSRGLVGNTNLVPTRNDEEEVTKVVVETHIKAKTVVPADSQQAKGMLARILKKWADEDKSAAA